MRGETVKATILVSFLALLSAGCLQDAAEGGVGGASDAGADSSTDTLSESVCTTDTDCDDGNPCTMNMCGTSGTCVHTQVNNYLGGICSIDGKPGICVAGTCEASECSLLDNQCDDKNPATVDTCAQGGNCNFIPSDQSWGCNSSSQIDCTVSGGTTCVEGWLHFIGNVCADGACQQTTLSAHYCPGGCQNSQCLP